MDENLAWLTQKTEEPKCNKGNSLPPHTYKKVTTLLHLYINSPLFRVIPLSSKTFVTLPPPPPPSPPQVTQFLEDPTSNYGKPFSSDKLNRYFRGSHELLKRFLRSLKLTSS